ncbi:MAG: hypothetical protein V9G23_09130 [Giesbergeria sp.]
MSQAIIGVRAIEQAITVKGANGVTGEDVRTALLTNPISTERSFGILPSITFQADAQYFPRRAFP